MNRRSRKTQTVQFADSLAHVVLGTMATVARAPYYEGFDQWVYVTYAALPEDLRKDIQLVVGPIGVPLCFRELLRNAPRADDLTSFIGWITTIPDRAIEQGIHSILEGLAAGAAAKGGKTVEVPVLDDEAAFRAFLAKTQCEWTEVADTDGAYLGQLMRLLREPGGLKARLVLTITRFWESYFREIYAECRTHAERSVRHHQTFAYEDGIARAFLAVAGRPVPAGVEKAFANLETLVFVPNCFTGPFVQFVSFDPEGEKLALLYNCRTQGGTEGGREEAVRRLFSPLKALADETRLEILSILGDKELYAQQIVDQMDITQPAVSRHLKLMVAGGILSMRKENGMKYVSVNTDALVALGTQLIEFTAERSEHA